MDEIQIASTNRQTISKSFTNAGFTKAGLFNKQLLYENDVKILEYSATPNGTLYDLAKWDDASAKILADPGVGYTSAFDMESQSRVRNCGDLYNKDTDPETKDEGDKKVMKNFEYIEKDIVFYKDQRYHIIRTHNGASKDITIANFKKFFGERKYNYCSYDQKGDIKDINDMLKKKPEKHTFIFIIEKLRCAKTLHKEYIGICYERYTGEEPDDSVIIQGCLGRLLGYKDNGVSICYTNLNSIEKYKKLWDSNFEEDVGWNSNTTKRDKNGIPKDPNTFNNMVVSTDDSDEGSTTDEPAPIVEPTIVKRKTLDEIRTYYSVHLKDKIKEKTGKNVRGPHQNKKKHLVDGFYQVNIRGTTKVWSWDEILKEKKCGAGQGAGYAIRPCYKDTSDPNTLEWWLIHYY